MAKTTIQKANLILEVAQELGFDTEDYGGLDGLVEHGMRFIQNGVSEEEAREHLACNL